MSDQVTSRWNRAVDWLQEHTEVSLAVPLLAVLTMICVGVFLSGVDAGMHSERRDAVRAGAGRYVVDPATGATRFEYIKAGSNP